jgi:hypothetical protein
MATYEQVEVEIHAFLILVLNGDELSTASNNLSLRNKPW